MDWLRIGRVELYKVRWQDKKSYEDDSSWSINFKPSLCGCRLAHIFKFGATLLGKDCRETQGPDFFQFGKYASSDENTNKKEEE